VPHDRAVLGVGEHPAQLGEAIARISGEILSWPRWVDAPNFRNIVSGAHVRVRDAVVYDDILRGVSGLSVLAIVASRAPERVRPRALPRYPDPASRPTPALVPGEAHVARTYGPAPNPTWLTIPQTRPLHGRHDSRHVGTGKTSACMYPYVNQLLRWRAGDPHRKLGGLAWK
jgi:hypothetical protein